jgi:hypothetical protein
MSEAHVDPAILLASWLGELEGTEADDVEAHVFTCDTCATELDHVRSMVSDVETLTRACPPPTLTRDELTRLRSRGVRVLELEFPAFGRAPLDPIPAGIDVVVSAIPVDLHDVRSVDIAIFNQYSDTPIVVPEVRFDRHDGAVFVACSRHVAASNSAFRVRVDAETTNGERRVLADTGIVPFDRGG